MAHATPPRRSYPRPRERRGGGPRPRAGRAVRRPGQAGRSLRGTLRWLRGNAIFGLLALSSLAVLAALGLVARGAPAGAANSPDASSSPAWIPLRSQAPGDILAAVRASPLFHVNRAGSGDYLRDVSRLGTPMLVTELPLGGVTTPQDAYAVPILDANGGTVGVAVAWLAPDATALDVGYIHDYDSPLPSWPMSLPQADRAPAAVAARSPVSWRPAGLPRLVYFPFDFSAQEAGTLRWNGGGEGPDDPVWLVPGTNGADRVLGIDGHVYPLDALPVAPHL